MSVFHATPTYNCVLCCFVFAGQNCDLIESLCHSAPCQHNGTCSGDMQNYTCSCPFEWKGTDCEIQVCVNFCKEERRLWAKACSILSVYRPKGPDTRAAFSTLSVYSPKGPDTQTAFSTLSVYKPKGPDT